MNNLNAAAMNDDPETGDDNGDAGEAKVATAPKTKKTKSKSKAKSGGKKSTKPAAAAAPKGKKTTGKKTTSKANGASKDAGKKKAAPKERSANFGKAEEYARKISKDYGSVTVVRAVSQKFSDLVRGDVMALAEKLGINKFTASRQFHVARSGEVEIDLSNL